MLLVEEEEDYFAPETPQVERIAPYVERSPDGTINIKIVLKPQIVLRQPESEPVAQLQAGPSFKPQPGPSLGEALRELEADLEGDFRQALESYANNQMSLSQLLQRHACPHLGLNCAPFMQKIQDCGEENVSDAFVLETFPKFKQEGANFGAIISDFFANYRC